MIPAIGFMIGCYIIARAIEMFCKDYKGAGKVIMGLVAVILIAVTMLNLVDLFSAAQSSSNSLGSIPSF